MNGMLVNPKPCSLSNFEPWRTFQAHVDELRPAALEAIADRLCREQEKAYPPLAKCVRQQLAAAREDDDLAREIVRIALSLGDFTAYASYPTKGKAFAIDAKVWDVMAFGYHDACRSIDEGIFAIDLAKCRANKLDPELACSPLFINKGVANFWLEIKPSGEQQRETAKAIIEHYKDQHGEQSMRRADFIKAAVDQLPGLSPNRALQLWREHAPDAWKRPGTKKGH